MITIAMINMLILVTFEILLSQTMKLVYQKLWWLWSSWIDFSNWICTISNITIAKDFDLLQFDIKIAFLHGCIHGKLYMCQQPTFIEPHTKYKKIKVLLPYLGITIISFELNESFNDHVFKTSIIQLTLCLVLS
jgi:hypothetical protein